MVTILTIDAELDSAERLGFPTILYYAKKPRGVVIRWGNSELIGSDFAKVVNPSKAISLNCHKLKALIKMSKVVDTPKIFSKTVPDNELALIRPLQHANGKDFRIVTGPYDIYSGEEYGTEWITTDLEYRVWFAWNRTICAKRVVLKNDSHSAQTQYPCRSEWGYKFVKKVPARLHSDVMKAKKAIGLDVGAADILVKGKKYIFLELNSAPTVDAKRIREFFQNAIKEKCRK